MEMIFWALIFCILVNLTFFIFANTLKTDKLTDLSYGLTFILLSILLLMRNKTFYPYQILIAVMIIIWGIRLAAYLFIRILKIKKDIRFDDKRDNTIEFLKFWVFQSIAVWIIMLPSIYLLTLNENTNLNPIMILGFMIWGGGFIIETVSDWQKFSFRNNPVNVDKWIETGLWKYSRHPNYFGEMLCWIGIFIYAIPLLQGLAWLTIISPLFIIFILRYVSGVPLLEKINDEKWGNNKKYQEYKKHTSLIILSSQHK